MAQTFNDNLELSSLAAIFKDGSLYSVVEDILEPSSYGYAPYGIVYKAIRNVVGNDLYPDIVTIEGELDRMGLLEAVSILSTSLRGRDALKYISTFDVNVDALEYYALSIQEFQAIRKLITLQSEMGKQIEAGRRPAEILSNIDIETGKIAVSIGAQSKNVRTAFDVARESVDLFKKATDGKSLLIPTGFSFWDDFTNGLCPQRLYMIAARSNEGKTALAENITYNISVVGKIPVHYFSLESSAEEVNNRLIQIMTGISPLSIERGVLNEEEKELYRAANARLSQSVHTYDDSPELSLALLRTKIRKAVAGGARVIIIDQLEQLVIGGAGDSQAEYIKLNYIAYRVKAYAREMNVPIIILHQLNRSSESGENRNKEVDLTLADLAQAGEKPCDAILMLRTKTNPCIYWVKNRQGKKDKRPIKWLGSHIRFSDLEGYSEFSSSPKQDALL